MRKPIVGFPGVAKIRSVYHKFLFKAMGRLRERNFTYRGNWKGKANDGVATLICTWRHSVFSARRGMS